ncbi:HEAT repeat domain-containing protein [Halapricum hydrolyticum]|uniref:HEAT repeat domain-containing protein n=1 Tax=Halapricum hydrolyticum TaxID=2979991 RepID=A0AAE3LHE7_9EURY|nr:HEAT repeat domain-containing protein [Halapricum hydrolyticum]MCU4717602.1 HEAT repeat domain-containing protein [Halapricum hydrolyticum]MCU4726869.1 HEAT repeat domain-containing protein [Halapricum hydrolyticum]
MSNGDDEDATDEDEADEVELTDVSDFETRLAEVGEALEAAETESDLEDIEATIGDLRESLDATDLPGTTTRSIPRKQAIEEQIEELQENLDAHRVQYTEDVVDAVEDVVATIRETRWTEDGSEAVDSAVIAFLDRVDEEIDTSIVTAVLDRVDEEIDADGAAELLDEEVDTDAAELFEEAVESDAAELLDGVAQTLSTTARDPLSRGLDAEAIDALLTAADDLEDDIDAAESWDDLTVREQLTAEGFYDVLGPEARRDYPPEWNAVKIYEKRYQQDRSDEEAIEMILLALEKLPGGKEHFMEENILESLARIAPPEALDDVLPMAGKRNKKAITVVGKIGDPEALDTLLDFIEGDGDLTLQLTTLRAVGAIGSEEATQAVANRLAAEEADIRSAAARALGRIGDTRAIEPLADVLAEDPEDTVRASAAWALIQIGTERAFEAVEDNADDSYLVQVEAEKAALSS